MALKIASRLALLLLLGLVSCGKRPAPPVPPTPTATPVPVLPTPTPTPAPTPSLALKLTGEPALHHAGAICALGPRGYSGAGRFATRRYLTQVLATLGWQVTPQAFQIKTPAGTRDYVNLLARFATPEGKTLSSQSFHLLAAHYDAPESRISPFPAASDGASGCGVLLEIAALLAREPEAARRIELVFWDGEAPIRQPDASDGLHGSRFFTTWLRQNGRLPDLRSALVLRAIGHRGAVWTLPLMSDATLNATLNGIADKQVWPGQVAILGRPVWSGHLPLFEAGAPVTVLTDAGYLSLNTADDTPGRLDTLALKRAAIAALECGLAR